ncbi:hypothetical protein CON36_30710 [Bacillus cereus]|uniref:Uncharacterized protein n=1 Tax=Bacillus cereus TaxID=1396 RepID=A0A9X6XW90_BACCE|nr:hypothetical protein [Bacillus cereus]PDZ95001.1 hypothetical protein CON36_30710 [Bacillus cereus]
MKFVILAFSIVFIFCMHHIANLVMKNATNSNMVNKKYVKLLQFAKFAPIIALLVLSILVVTTLHTKPDIRLYHAWFAAQFWAYYTFLFCSYMITKSKVCLLPMVAALLIASYITPLNHFEDLFTGNYVFIAEIMGSIMFVYQWTITRKIHKEMNRH